MTAPPDDMEKIMQRLAKAHSLSILREKELIPTKKDFMTLGFQKFLMASYIAGARQWREIGRAEGEIEGYETVTEHCKALEEYHLSDSFECFADITRAKLEALLK